MKESMNKENYRQCNKMYTKEHNCRFRDNNKKSNI